MMDIYFEKEYGQLYEDIEKGKCEVFKHTSSLGKIHHMFIKREIPFKVDNNKYFDLVTPYGYGGPLIIEHLKGTKKELVKEFEHEFNNYCIENNIVSEFIRFHPLIKNALDFKSIYDTEYIRNTVGTNLKDYDDPFQSEFSKSSRKNVRKVLRREDISYKITKNPKDISEFKDIYYSTMDRNKADEYYYFDDAYFSKCVNFFNENILLIEVKYNEKIIAMGFYFIYGDIIHVHLSGTLSEYQYLSPDYLLQYATSKWGKENDYHLIHQGGGRTNDLEDGLYKFKKQFGNNTEFEFYIGKKIWNQPIYSKLCEISNIEKEESFFPAYRKN